MNKDITTCPACCGYRNKHLKHNHPNCLGDGLGMAFIIDFETAVRKFGETIADGGSAVEPSLFCYITFINTIWEESWLLSIKKDLTWIEIDELKQRENNDIKKN